MSRTGRTTTRRTARADRVNHPQREYGHTFQVYFLQRFTEGNIPEAFASAPETWSPDQIEQFQEFWDSIMYGDQSRKHQIRWLPGGSTLAWSNEKDFSDEFSLHMLRKTCAAFHVVPSDLGFTETVNRSSGESQADVQHRVGDLPLMSTSRASCPRSSTTTSACR